MLNFKRFVLIAAGAVASVGAAGAADAADANDVVAPQMALHYKPSDLNSEEGIQRVYSQIRSAAEDVCPSVTTGTHLASERSLSCRRAAIANAVAAIHSKRLAEVASEAKSG